MKSPWANISLLLILAALTGTGYLGLVNGNEAAAWRLWIHGISAYSLIVLFLWKSRIIFDAVRRKKTWTRQRIMFGVMLLMLLITVLMGLLWTFDGPRYLGGFSLVSLHIYIAVPMMIFVAWHTRRMKFIFKVKGAMQRRLFLGTAVSALFGTILWRAAGKGKEVGQLVGAKRRFTGSYERHSFSGRFPSVSWIADRPSPIDTTGWQLTIDGAVERPLSISYDELLHMLSVKQEILLDCTSGWYTTQIWEGVLLTELLVQAKVLHSARSITVAAISKYRRRFDLTTIHQMLLATKMADLPLTHGHGAPLRLVIPDRRGFEWVKWVTHVRLNTTSALLQSPLPLR